MLTATDKIKYKETIKKLIEDKVYLLHLSNITIKFMDGKDFKEELDKSNKLREDIQNLLKKL